MSVTFTVKTIDDVNTADEYMAYLRQNRTMVRYFAMQYAIGASDLQAMLRSRDRAFGRRGRARRAAAPLRKLAGACADASTFISLAMARFQMEYADDIKPSVRSRANGRQMNF